MNRTNRTAKGRLGALLRATPLVLAATIGLLPTAHADTLLTTHGTLLACTDQPVPGPSGAYYEASFDNPVVADDGTVLFRAKMYGGDVSNNANSRALFLGTTAADLSMMIRGADPAPGLPDLSLTTSSGNNGIQNNCRLSPDGRAMWSSYLSGPGVVSGNDSAMFGGSPSSQAPIAREGDAAPGTSGAVFSGDRLTSQFTAMDRNGAVVFQTNLSGGDVVGTTNNVALYAGLPGALSLVFRKGDTLLPGPVTAAALPNFNLIDGSGRVLYNPKLAGAGVSTSNDASLWVYTPGSGNTLLAREGQTAPGTAGATFNDSFDTWQPNVPPGGLNGTGQYVMSAALQGGDVVGGANDMILYVGSTSGGITKVARKGDPAPGTDAVFAGFVTNQTFINNAGVVLTLVNLSGGTSNATNNSALYLATPTGVPAAPYALTLIVRAGDPAPGAPGDVFGPVSSQGTAFNDLGQAVFNRDLQGPDIVVGVNDRGLWAWDATHGVHILARGGDPLEVSAGTFLTPSSFGYLAPGNTDGSSQGLSKNGKLAMNVGWLEGGSSVVTLDLGCYPPSTWYADADGDGYGDAATSLSVCANATAPAGYVTNATDCDDTNPGVHPGASDSNCNGIDENCNGTADEGYVSHPTSCGIGACARTGASSCVNGVETNGCVPGAPAAETCNGIDDNCDGTVDNAAAPTGTPALLVSRGAGAGMAHLSWSAVSAATGYDAVMGDLHSLAASHGSFSVATTGCLGNDLAATAIDESTVPAAGQGLWYVLRAVNCGGNASYNSGAGSQTGSRDAGIAASGHACP